jgi:TRAP-type C4-dicarboxylate transport system permease small subunit
MSTMQAQARSAGTQATHSRAFEVLTRLGFVARGAIYIIVGLLAIQVAMHTSSNARTDQRGAMEVIDHQPFGHWLLIVVAVGLGAYAIWRFVQAYAGQGPEGGGDHSTLGRIAAACSGCAYAALCVLAIAILIGSSSSSSSNTHKQTAGVLGWPGGQYLVGAAGLIFVGVALYQAYKGLSRKFLEEDKTEQMGETTKRVLTVFGVIGYLARTVAFGLIGIFLIRAAVDYKPHAAVGLDGALARVGHHQYGTLLLGLVAAGLIAFGLYSVADARYRRI